MKPSVAQTSTDTSVVSHVGIIMDGNGRWAKTQGKKRSQGHTQGVKTAIDIVKHASDAGLKYLTLYAFSSENWKRPTPEVTTLMKLLHTFLVQELPTFIENRVRLQTIGNIDKLPALAKKTLRKTIETTQDFDGMTLVLALSYGGRDELTRACQKIAHDVSKGDVLPKDIDQDLISTYLDTCDIPDPELIIRTSGEFRTSNFLPWQSTYAEYVVTDTLWPDFTTHDFDQAISTFASRDRRFGGV